MQSERQFDDWESCIFHVSILMFSGVCVCVLFSIRLFFVFRSQINRSMSWMANNHAHEMAIGKNTKHLHRIACYSRAHTQTTFDCFLLHCIVVYFSQLNAHRHICKHTRILKHCCSILLFIRNLLIKSFHFNCHIILKNYNFCFGAIKCELLRNGWFDWIGCWIIR